MRPFPSLPLRLTLPACLLVLALAGPARAAEDVDTLAAWLAGSFSSAAQAAADSAYFDIRLHVVPIWPERADGPWLYVEQAVASRPDRPYRQRVYRVREVEPGLLASEVSALPGDPLAWAGHWRRDDPLADLAPADLLPRDGCTVLLRRDGFGAFSGGTVGRGCGSSLRGAAWAASEVVVAADTLTSWDRGFAADGAQVWGAEAGPYVFVRQAPAR